MKSKIIEKKIISSLLWTLFPWIRFEWKFPWWKYIYMVYWESVFSAHVLRLSSYDTSDPSVFIYRKRDVVCVSERNGLIRQWSCAFSAFMVVVTACTVCHLISLVCIVFQCHKLTNISIYSAQVHIYFQNFCAAAHIIQREEQLIREICCCVAFAVVLWSLE